MLALIPRRLLMALAILTSYSCFTAANAEPKAEYNIASVPDWVVPVKAANSNPNMDSVGGERYLLIDRQHYDDGSGVAVHHHRVVEIVGQAGLSDNSKLSVTFDPSYQRLELHSALVTRNGQQADRLPKARISVARTENDFDRNLLHGDVNALVILPDVRVGDTVEIRYTVFGRNPVFDSPHHSRWRMRWSVPVERASLRITVPEAMRLRHTLRPGSRPSEWVHAGQRTLQWSQDGLEASFTEPDTPGSYPNPNILEVTAYNNWQAVARWGDSLFQGHASSGDTYQHLSRSIQRVKETEGIDAAIAMAIDHVQKNIRYYGLELGENSHRPHTPDEVLENGYGDCKDKVLLLVSLLQDLDVKAWPLLVSSRLKKGVAERLPGPGVFDHVIVLIEHNDEQYWVDATDSRQAGLLGTRGQPEYGAGLVLGKPGETMITREARLPLIPDSSTHDEFHISSIGGPVDLTSTKVLRGRNANGFRSSLDRTGRRSLERWLEERYESIYGDLQSIESMTITEDQQRNEITVSLRYRLNEFWEVDERANTAEFDTYATAVTNSLDDFDEISRNRAAPMVIDGPSWTEHRIQFYPNMASPERSLEETTFSIPGFAYFDSEYILGNSMVFDSEIKVSVDEITPDKLSGYHKFRKRVRRNATVGRYIRSINKDRFAIGTATTNLLAEMGALHP